MKKFLIIFISLCFCLPAFSTVQAPRKMQNPPVGSFKKQKNGTYVQYNHKGKKIGVYKIENNNLVKIK